MTAPTYLQGTVETWTERFLAHWLGPATHPNAPAVKASGVPPALLDHHRTRQRWELADTRICRWIPPKYAYPDEHSCLVITVFLQEQEGVQSWGVDVEGAMGTRIAEEDETWTPLRCGLVEFLIGYELAEMAIKASVGPGATSVWVRPEQVDTIVAPLTPLPVPRWHMLDSPHRLYGDENALALVGPNPFGGETPETATGWEVFLAGRRAGALDWLADLEGVVHEGDGWESREQLEAYDGIVWDTLLLR